LQRKKNIVHVTHETTDKMGGIGAVLEGLITSQPYIQTVNRTLIIGPLFSRENLKGNRLGAKGKILYSSLDGITNHPSAGSLAEVERKFGVSIVYGIRTLSHPYTQVKNEAEVVLIDVSRVNIHPVNMLKAWMFEEFGIESIRYEDHWEYDQYVKLAPAALAVLRTLGVSEPNRPAVIIAHEYMGMPTALAGVMDPLVSFKAVFYAHEVATIRRIVEESPGHDAMFYNVLNWARKKKYYLDEIFGPQDFFFKHALIHAARYCDNIIAVSDNTVQELRFLGPEFDDIDIDLAYNGLMVHPISLEEKLASKEKMHKYTENLLGRRSDYVFTHVARMTTGKAFWRDLRILYHLENQFCQNGRTGVYYLISTDAPTRDGEDVQQMEEDWKWPVAHREKGSDLTESEAGFYTYVQEFNARCRNIKAVFVNQFGWDSISCGRRMPPDMTWQDLRQGSDLEFGQSIYEPFGIAPLEALGYGSLCVISNVSGCLGFLQALNLPALPDNIIIADYARLQNIPTNLNGLLSIDQTQRDKLEEQVSEQLAQTILQRLPYNNPQESQVLLTQGYETARQMTWDIVCQKYFLPAVERAYKKRRSRKTA